MNDVIIKSIQQHIDVVKLLQSTLIDSLAVISKLLVETIKNGNTIFWCGNGGSAADCQHLAAELIGRFKEERPAIASIALTTDTSILTCLGNDYGYDSIFERQVSGLAKPDDVLMCLSTTGNSANVIAAARIAKEHKVHTVALLGNDGGNLAALCQRSLVIPSNDTARIQEMHIMVGHILCDIIEKSVINEG